MRSARLARTPSPRPVAAQQRASRIVASLAVAIALLSPTALAVPVGPSAVTPDCAWSDDVIGRFLRSVQRGELTVFGKTVDADQLRPVRIKYAFELGSRAQTVSVHAELVSAIPLHTDDRMVVRSVEVVMGRDGHIAETRAHVTPR